MANLRGVVSSSVEVRFREMAMKKFGFKKGSLSKALEEAVLQWIESNNVNMEK